MACQATILRVGCIACCPTAERLGILPNQPVPAVTGAAGAGVDTLAAASDVAAAGCFGCDAAAVLIV